MANNIVQVALPWYEKDSCGLPPSASHRVAYGIDGETEVKYSIMDYDGGQSDESGQLLWSAYVCIKKTSNCHSAWVNQYRFEPRVVRLFIASNGDAFRSWKGGRPVANFKTHQVFRYKRVSMKRRVIRGK